MKTKRIPLITLLAIHGSFIAVSTVSAVDSKSLGILDIYPAKAIFKPGEPIRIAVSIRNPGGPRKVRLNLDFMHIDKIVAKTETAFDLKTGNNLIYGKWKPPAGTGAKSPVAYGVEGTVVDTGDDRNTGWTAVDVSPSWTLVPRYGFMSDFGPTEPDPTGSMLEMAKYHVNAVQFYDWMYRHDTLIPPSDTFVDSMGRTLSLGKVRTGIAIAKSLGMASMAYSAIYAASPDFANEHDDWNIYKGSFLPYDFGDGYLRLMNPEPGKGWAKHLSGQLGKAIDTLKFDGIHLDQYGYPQRAFRTMDAIPGDELDLAKAFRGFVDQAVTRLKVPVVFNCVNDWPTPSISPSKAAISYIEVWEPNEEFKDLNMLINRASKLGPGKGVVLAAYNKQVEGSGPLLTDAVIMASGGWHLELGEGINILTDPYFPNYSKPSQELATSLRKYYDFATRYEELLSIPGVDGIQLGVEAEGIRTTDKGEAGCLWSISRISPGGRIAVNLINMVGLTNTRWRTVTEEPQRLENAKVRFHGVRMREVKKAWLASPDGTNTSPESLSITKGRDGKGYYVELTVPGIERWAMVVLEA